MKNRTRRALLIGAAVLALAAVLLIRLHGRGPEAEEISVMETRREAVADEGYFTVKKTEGEMYYPLTRDWTYHFTYAYPYLEGDTYTAALINDTYDLALGETKDIALPMFARDASERWEVRHDFSVACNTERLLSILLRQERIGPEGQGGKTLEAQTFNVGADTAGDVMTLRGTVLLLIGVENERLLTVTAEDLPEYPGIVNGSSDLMEERLLPLLYEEFQRLQTEGVIRRDADYDDYEASFAPSRDFYALPDGRVAFFFPPSLLAEPSFDVPVFSFTPEEIEALL